MMGTLEASYLMMLGGVIIIGFGLKGFLVPNNFFDGGVTGISLLIHDLYHFNLAYVIILANIPLLIIGIYTINLKFAIKSLLCIIALSALYRSPCFSFAFGGLVP